MALTGVPREALEARLCRIEWILSEEGKGFEGLGGGGGGGLNGGTAKIYGPRMRGEGGRHVVRGMA